MTVQRSCIVIFGPGRSGTSIATKLLVESGMRLSSTVVPPSADNPMGYFEDARMAELHQKLVGSWQLSPYAPRDPAVLERPQTQEFQRDLTALVTAEVTAESSIWGIKDPRICTTWPIWQRICSEASIRPRPVFCVRDPQAIVRSLVKAYAMSSAHAEALYLFRSLHALEDVTEGWFFAQYEAWHDRESAQQQLAAMISYCGIEANEADLGAIAAGNVRADLNRSSHGNALAISPVLFELHELLAGFTGEQYTHSDISAWCASVRTRLADFAFIQQAVEDLRQQAAPSFARRALRKGARTARDLMKRDSPE